MNLKLVRWIDYWVGIPLTAVFSVVDFFRSRATSNTRFHSKRILFIELSEMGSAIIAHSAIARAIEELGPENVFFLIFSRNRESVDLLSTLDPKQVLVIDDESFLAFVVSTFRSLFLTWRLRIDTAVDLELFSRFTALFSYATLAKIRVGFHRFTNEGLFRGTFLNRAVLYNNHQHMALNFLALVDAAFSESDEIPFSKKDVSGELRELPILDIRADEFELAQTQLRPLTEKVDKIIVLNPHPGLLLPIRGWPLEHYVALVEKIVTKHPTWGIVLVGLPEASAYADRLCHACPGDRMLNLIGKTKSLRELLALLKETDLFITNDSGPAHFASLVRARSIVLFGPETSTLYGPLHREAISMSSRVSCSPCFSAYNHRTTACTNNRCLQEVSPDRVLRAAESMLSGLPIVDPISSSPGTVQEHHGVI